MRAGWRSGGDVVGTVGDWSVARTLCSVVLVAAVSVKGFWEVGVVVVEVGKVLESLSEVGVGHAHFPLEV